MPEGGLSDQALAPCSPSGPSLINEYKSLQVNPPWCAFHRLHFWAISGRSCSLAIAVFFEAEALGMREISHRVSTRSPRSASLVNGKAYVHGGRKQVRQTLDTSALVSAHFSPDMKVKVRAVHHSRKKHQNRPSQQSREAHPPRKRPAQLGTPMCAKTGLTNTDTLKFRKP